MTSTQKLLRDIETKRKNWDDRSQFKLKGIGNLSQADLGTLELYARYYERLGHFGELMEPRGSTKEVLDAYNIKATYKDGLWN